MSSHQRQRQRHGVTKHLVEGLGGALTGAALVVFLRSWWRHRQNTASTPTPQLNKDPTP